MTPRKEIYAKLGYTAKAATRKFGARYRTHVTDKRARFTRETIRRA